jgi:hypothetical protein
MMARRGIGGEGKSKRQMGPVCPLFRWECSAIRYAQTLHGNRSDLVAMRCVWVEQKWGAAAAAVVGVGVVGVRQCLALFQCLVCGGMCLLRRAPAPEAPRASGC